MSFPSNFAFQRERCSIDVNRREEMKRIPKQGYTGQLKDQMVAMVKSGKKVPDVARALGLVERTGSNFCRTATRGECWASC